MVNGTTEHGWGGWNEMENMVFYKNEFVERDPKETSLLIRYMLLRPEEENDRNTLGRGTALPNNDFFIFKGAINALGELKGHDYLTSVTGLRRRRGWEIIKGRGPIVTHQPKPLNDQELKQAEALYQEMKELREPEPVEKSTYHRKWGLLPAN